MARKSRGLDRLASAQDDLIIAAVGETRLGTDGNDNLSGTEGDDIFRLEEGGEDTAKGGGGNDGFYMGGELSAGDDLDGEAGDLDQLGLQGDYGTFGEISAPFTFTANHLKNIEQIVLLPASDDRFVTTGATSYTYNLKTINENVGAGQRLVLTANTLEAEDIFVFDGSAETDGYFLTFGGEGADILTGGDGDDGFFFGTDKRFGSGDSVDGNGGSDQLGLQGFYTGESAISFGDNQLEELEFIVLLSGGDTRFGSNGVGYSYDIEMSDGNVANGQTMIISANTLASDEKLTFRGADETDGAFRIFSGNGADDITGGAKADEIFGLGGVDKINGGGGADRIIGGLGGDFLTGGDGDTFVYESAAESTSLNFDTLTGFDFRIDRVDLPNDAPAFSDVVQVGRLDKDSFDTDLSAALNGVLGAGEAAVFIPDDGSFGGRTFGIVDANGVAGYQSGEDYVFELVNPVVPPGPTTDFFI